MDALSLPPQYFALETPTQRILRAVATANAAGHGATQAELANDTGYSQQTISRLVLLQVQKGTLRLYRTGQWTVIYIARDAGQKAG